MKKIVSQILKVLIAAAILAGIGLLFAKVFSNPITPVTSQQMYDALSAQGYKPQYATQLVSDDLQKIGLTDCVVAEQDDIKINFYFLNNEDAAQIVYNMSVSLIHTERYDPPTRDYSEGNSNHWRYTMIGQTMYSTVIQVGNTAIYAYSNTENAAKINALLKSIGYTQIEGSGQSSPELSPLFGLLLTIAWLPLVLLCRHWMWPLVYRSSGKSQKEIELFSGKNTKRVPKHKIITWLIKESIHPRQTIAWSVLYNLPLILEYMAIIFAFANLFTDVLNSFFDVYIFIVVGSGFAFAIICGILNEVLYRVK